MLFDTHTHLDQEEFDANRSEVVSRAEAVGVTRIVAVGTTAAASAKCVELAQQFPGVFAAVGIQPNYVAEAAPDDWEAIERLVTSPQVVAVGETGLDRHWDYSPFELQQDYFDRHIRLAERHDLPFVVHMRDCEADILEMLRMAQERGPLKGIMHSFTGGPAMAAECVAMGLHISFAGMVTYKKSQELRDCATTIPAERLLLETDCPYLSPEPVRSKQPNEPANLVHTAECLALVRGVTQEELARQTTENALALFGVQ
jgi:TatD DNase family protein